MCCVLNANQASAGREVPLTATLVAWISSQCEMIVDEMDAIIKNNVESSSFSVVNYLRYLNLYDSLKVVGNKGEKDVPEFKWVYLKARAYAKVYKAALDVVSGYLVELDNQLRKIEDAEPKSKQVTVSKQWLSIYEVMRYIATHSPRNSELRSKATEMLTFSPTGNGDKVRSTRYGLRTNAFSR